MSKCARPDCKAKAKSSCSVCKREQYCGSNCQKLDWKIHKSMCPILKKLSTQLQPFHEVIRIKNQILISNKGKDARVLQHLLSYLEHQFGEKITGIDYRERGNGERISNWEVEVMILYNIYHSLANFCDHDNSMSMISRNEMGFPNLERSLNLLNPWLIKLDLDASNRIDSCNDHRMNHILENLAFVEMNMAVVTMTRRQLDIAEGHCQRCLAYSRRYGLEGGKKITHILAALRIYCDLRQRQRDYSGAVDAMRTHLTIAKSHFVEAQRIWLKIHGPTHPYVIDAASRLNVVLRQLSQL